MNNAGEFALPSLGINQSDSLGFAVGKGPIKEVSYG